MITRYSSKENEKTVRKLEKFQKMVQLRLKFARLTYFKYFYKWKFQVKMGFPFYTKKKHTAIVKACERDTQNQIITARVNGTHKISTPLEILSKIDLMRSIIDRKIKASKRLFFRKAKILFQVQKIILSNNNPILFQSMKFNQEGIIQKYKKDRNTLRMDIYKPEEVLRIISSQKEMLINRFSEDKIDLEGHSYTLEYLKKIYYIGRKGASSSEIMLSGIWTLEGPLLKFKEILLKKILSRWYRKTMAISMQKLALNNEVIAFKTVKLKELTTGYFSMKSRWAKIWILNIGNDRVKYIYSHALNRLEIHRRIAILLDFRKEREKMLAMKKKGDFLDKDLTMDQYQQSLEEIFTNRLNEAHRVFPDQFVKALLFDKSDAQATKQRITYLLFDTMFFLVTDLIGQAKLTQEALKN